MMSVLIALGIVNLLFASLFMAGQVYGAYCDVSKILQTRRLIARTQRVNQLIYLLLGHTNYGLTDSGKGPIVLRVPMGTGVELGTKIVREVQALLPRGTEVEIEYASTGGKDVN